MPTEKGRDIDRRSAFIPFSASRTTRRVWGDSCTTIRISMLNLRQTGGQTTLQPKSTRTPTTYSTVANVRLSQGLASTGEVTKVMVTSPVWASSADGESGQP